MGQHQSVIVIGGGVVGSSIAWHIARRGESVTLLEARSIAAVASGASAGGVRQQGRDPREMPLAIAAIERWRTLEDELEADLHYYRNGHLVVYATADEVEAGRKSVETQRQLGLEIEMVEGPALAELAPGLAPEFVAGSYTLNDGHADPTRTTQSFARAAERSGAVIREGSEVERLLLDGDRVIGVETKGEKLYADHVVIAAGAWARELVRPLSIDLPFEAHGLQMLLTRPMPALLKQVVGAAGRPLSLKQLREGNYLIGGGWPGDIDMVSGKGRVREQSVQGSFETASGVFPELRKTEVERSWVGIEAISPDGVPIIGNAPGYTGLVIAAGFSGHGFALSPTTGQLVSELVLDGAPSISLDAFVADRFDAGDSVQRIVPSAG
ncbi:MAG: FAD-binding oxidoreductase [Thermomicrobiales bacterium]|nr:FAD-binding oxidoreductase [Thermomicrobiales bacterium]